MATDLNAARKARAGNADTGRCTCGSYLRVICRDLCMQTLVEQVRDSRSYDEPDSERLLTLVDGGQFPDAAGTYHRDGDDDADYEGHLADLAYQRWREGR